MSVPPLDTSDVSHLPILPPKRDHLTTLPPELFGHINSFIYGPQYTPYNPYDGPYLGGVSRAFLDHAREHHFGEVYITDQGNLRKFISAFAEHPPLAKFIRSVQVNFADSYEPDDGLVTDEELYMFLSDLVSLEGIHISSFTRFLKLVANPPSRSKPLPRMTYLALVDSFNDWRNPCDPRHWASLERYPELYEFSLCLLVRARVNGWTLPLRRLATVPQNTRITHVHLTGDLGINHATAAFFWFFRNVESITFKEVSEKSDQISSFLNKIPAPEWITELTVRDLDDWMENFPAAFERFQNLETLTLGHGTWRCSNVTEGLLNLPSLKTLYLRDECEERELLRFVKASPSLKSLVFRNDLELVRGWPLPLEEAQQIEHGWTEDFTPEGVVEVAKAARVKGICVEGTAIRSAEILVAAKAERDRIRE